MLYQKLILFLDRVQTFTDNESILRFEVYRGDI